MSKCVPLLGPKHPPVTSRASSKKGKSTLEPIGARCEYLQIFLRDTPVATPWCQLVHVSKSTPRAYVLVHPTCFFVKTQKIASFLKNSKRNGLFSPRSTNWHIFSCALSEKGGDDMCLGELKQMVTVSPVWLPGSANFSQVCFRGSEIVRLSV